MSHVRVAAVAALLVLVTPSALAVEGAKSQPSPFGGNGHNVSFDGRLMIVARGNGWNAHVFRPQNVTYDAVGFPDVGQGAFSPEYPLNANGEGENALAICEVNPAQTPFRCDLAGNATAAGAYDCYDVHVFDSNALLPVATMRRRRLKVWVSSPGTATATVAKHEWIGAMEAVAPALRGIEPTVTRDGRLMVWQGHPDNDGKIDILMYSVNPTPCAAGGWSAPKVITRMANDPATAGVWKLAERPLRDALGNVFADGELFRGAYPWLFPDGSAISFTAANMPCQSPEVPAGCGPRRNAFSVAGYPTNWAIGHVDGGVNPSRTDVVRLFFSSPGPSTFPTIPVTDGTDVWPFFGSNTSNYTELRFDDGLDGRYAGVWHMNEAVNGAGELLFDRTPDTGGYFHTGILIGGVSLPPANNGIDGKAAIFDGVTGRIAINDAPALTPAYALTVEARIRPASDPDCDGHNNWRLLLGKPDIGGSFSLAFEETRQLQARVVAGGVEHSVWSNVAIPVGQWTTVAFTYLATTGETAFFVDGVETSRVRGTPGTIDRNVSSLLVGGPGIAPACPDGMGAFHGEIDELKISNIVRYPYEMTGEPTPTPSVTPTPLPGGGDDDDGGAPGPRAGPGGRGPGLFGCSIAAAPATPPALLALLASLTGLFPLLARRRS